MSRLVAVVDIGSTSIQLTIAEVGATALTVLLKEKVIARLADGIDSNGELDPASVASIQSSLRRFSQLAQEHNAELRVTATATLRAAKNRHEILRNLQTDLGLSVRLLTGHDEARYVLNGVLFGHPDLCDTALLTVDVGGGSTELITATSGTPSTIASVPVGALVVQKQWLGFGQPSWSHVRHARRCLRARFENALRLSRSVTVQHLVGTGGTIQRLVRLSRGQSLTSDEINGTRLNQDELNRCIELLVRAKTPEGRRALPGIDLERADFLLGGALIYAVMLERFHAFDWYVSTSALRTGMLTSQ